METEGGLGKNHRLGKNPTPAAVIRAIDSATMDAKVILFLLYSCEGESVPEEVLRLMHPPSKLFHSIHELHTANLIEPNCPSCLEPNTNAECNHDRAGEELTKEWSLRTVIRGYLDVYFTAKEHIVRDIMFLLEIWSESEVETGLMEKSRAVPVALFALYFNPIHPNRFVRTAATVARIECSLTDWMLQLRNTDVGLNSVLIVFQMKAFILARGPEIVASHGGTFKVSRSYVRRWCRFRLG